MPQPTWVKDEWSHPDDQQFAELLSRITSQQQRGEPVHWESLFDEYPNFAEELAKVRPALDGLDVLKQLSPTACKSSEPNAVLPIEPRQPLGDFQLERELGRGGMGVVYEARQLSLGRLVAVKILPLASLVDRQALARFQNEVRAAATLEHPNIVSIYSVGEDRGVHFYAMQLIRGQSMAAVIRALHDLGRRNRSIQGDSIKQIVETSESHHTHSTGGVAPSEMETSSLESPSTKALRDSTTWAPQFEPSFFHNAIHLFIQAAEALEHAHVNGITHRDIKPGNLLVSCDNNLVVADFGLARIEAKQSLTMTGDVLGTLRYMSPEQLLAKPTLVDHRSDIYSLGLTMYEFLTLQPAFEGDDPPELIRQITTDEPLIPSRINRAIPRDLETIVLKAIRKTPVERYESAQDLANDLQRFLQHRPIIARRPRFIDRVRKLTRRHPAAMLATLAILLVLVIALGMSTILISRARNKADQHRARAEARTEIARQAVNDMYTDVASKWLDDEPELQPIQRAFLEKAILCLQQLNDEGDIDSIDLVVVGDSYHALGAMQSKLSQFDAATSSLQHALSHYLDAYKDSHSIEVLAKLAKNHATIIHVLNQREDYSATMEVAARSIESLESLAIVCTEKETQPSQNYRHHLAEIYYLRGLAAYELDSLDAAEANVRHAISISQESTSEEDVSAEYQVGLASAKGKLADVLKRQGLYADSRQVLLEAITHSELALEVDRRSRLAWQNLAASLNKLTGLNLFYLNNIEEAEASNVRHSEVAKRLVDDFGTYDYHHSHAASLYYKGQIAKRRQDHVVADSSFRSCIENCRELSNAFPDALKHRRLQAQCCMQLAQWVDIESTSRNERVQFNEEAVSIMEEVVDRSGLSTDMSLLAGLRGELTSFFPPTDLRRIEVQELNVATRRELVLQAPDIISYQVYLGAELNNLAVTLYQIGRHRAALLLLDEAIEVQEAAMFAQPENTAAADYLQIHYSTLTRYLTNCPDENLRDPGRAIQLAKQAMESPLIFGERSGQSPEQRLNQLRFDLAVAHFQLDEPELARPILVELAKDLPDDPGFCFAFSAVLSKCQSTAEAREWYERGCGFVSADPPSLVRSWRETAEMLLDCVLRKRS